MSFRFTPPCCCGGCWRIPACDEIFRGVYNYPAHLRDPDGVLYGIPEDTVTYVLRDNIAGYNQFNDDCSFFNIPASKLFTNEETGNEERYYFARDIGKTWRPGVYGNHLLNKVQYSCPAWIATNTRFGWYNYNLILLQEGVFATYVNYKADGTIREETDSGSEYNKYYNEFGELITPGSAVRSRYYFDSRYADWLPPNRMLWIPPRQVGGGVMSDGIILPPESIYDLMSRAHFDVRTYDGFLHSKGAGYWYRIFCLPYDYATYPIPYGREVKIIPESEVSGREDLYIPKQGNGQFPCIFNYPENCLDVSGVPQGEIFPAIDLTETLEALNEANREPIIDTYTVRLYGFTSPVWTSGIDSVNNNVEWREKWIDAVHGAEFLVSFVKCSDGHGGHEQKLIVMGDIATQDCLLEVDQVNPDDYNKKINVDYPEELLYYSRIGWVDWDSRYWYTDDDIRNHYWNYRYYLSKWSVRVDSVDVYGRGWAWGCVRPPFRPDEYAKPLDSRVVFGTPEATKSDDSAGNDGSMPTKWHSPKPNREYSYRYSDKGHWVEGTVQNRKDDADINNRFHGIYWVYAQIAPCRNQFREQVTHGRLRHVPIAEFEVGQEYEDMEYNYSHYPSNEITQILGSFPLTYSRGSEDFSYNDPLHQEIDRGSSAYNRYLDGYHARMYQASVTSSDYYTRPYIRKPKGWTLKEMVWRVFCCEADALHCEEGSLHRPEDYSLIPCTTADIEIFCDKITIAPNGDSSTVSFYPVQTTGALYPYNEENIGFTDNWDATYINNTGYDIAKRQFAYDNDYNLLERSVNGSGAECYSTFTDPDTGDILYFPALTKDQIEQLLARNGSLGDLKGAFFKTHIINNFYDSDKEQDYRNRNESYTYWTNFKLYVFYDIDYIAVWTPEELSE